MRNNISAHILCLLGLLLAFSGTAQQKSVAINRFYNQEIERIILQDSSFIHRGCKPYLENRLPLTRIHGLAKDSTKIYWRISERLYRKHFIEIRDKDVFIGIDPLFDFAYMNEMGDTSSYSDTARMSNNTRGFRVVGDLGKQFSFETNFYENQTFLPYYQKLFADSMRILPGFGRWKQYKIYGYDYAMASGYISYSPAQWINLQFGHGKNFIGHGYRSLMLSDAAFNYPYIKAQLQLLDNKLQYTAISATLQTLERLPLGEVPEALYKRKGASFHYLSWLPHPKLEVGLFEGIIWQRYDDDLGKVAMPWQAFVPIIGLGTLSYGFADKQNAFVGLNLRYDVNQSLTLYAQGVCDDPDNKAFGYQLGAKYFDLLIPHLDVQLEWNNLGQYLYTNHYRLQPFSHTNQPLGHPTGPLTNEGIGIINYRWKRFITQIKYVHQEHDLGPAGNFRRDPNDRDTYIAPWPTRRLQQWDVQVGIYLNPKTNMQLCVGWTDRLEKTDYNWQSDGVFHTSLLTFSFKTNLINRYSDF